MDFSTVRPHPLSFPEEPAVTRRLQRLVRKLVNKVEQQEDLFQEALLYLWRAGSENPRRNIGWFLRSCGWYLKDLLRRGRSVDSFKYRARLIRLEEKLLDPESIHLVSADDVVQNVAVNDLVAELAKHLVPPDRQVLLSLASGARLVEIARDLKMPPREVSRSRARIAQVAVELGINR